MIAPYDQTSQFLEGMRQVRRELITPEGVPLPVEIAHYGERATAFVIDLFIWLCASLLILVTVVLMFIHGWRNLVVISALLLILFLVRIFYFIYFELAWQGTTPGKRLIGVRVVDRRGGPLLPSAVIARNLMRELETFVPLGLVLSMTSAGLATPPLERLLAAAWLLCFGALPLFNRDRMRAGDLIAGTMVITLPRRRLTIDLVEKAASYTFTTPQLRAYGAFELQVLEELLRRPDVGTLPPLLAEVCGKICRKIGWPTPVPETEILAFLRDFYTAQRAFLEHEQLFGRPRADKHGSSR
jgi:uncharacterized RDD family membrane protein YckC